MTDKQWEQIKEGVLLAIDGVITDDQMVKGIEEITGKKIKDNGANQFVDPRSMTPILVV